ncbi:MAG: phospholipase D family protein [Oceanospirillaceae bacterium]|nr:phospholipase D family protein [Oceanospirillaceae bacterium]
MKRISRSKWLLVVVTLALVSCAGVPYDYPRTSSTTLSADAETTLGQIDRTWHTEQGEHSGFYPLRNGIEALGARLRMMETAQTSIDAQYFIIKPDEAGALFTGKLLSAADRGVRVRLLIDDIFTPNVDDALTLLDSHPNIEVRLFNPLSRQGFKYWNYLLDFRRANRRMHNKSFTVDNSLSIVGGRNIAEEYFELKQDVKFDDFEVLAIGPVVKQISTGFDEFWNSDLSVPVAAFGREVDSNNLDHWRRLIREQTDISSESLYAQAVNSTFVQDIANRRVEPVAAKAELVTDSPTKLLGSVGDDALATLGREIGRRLRSAQHEILIVTPYFVPQEIGARLLEDCLARGVRVIVVTNSLASTNHVPVHAGYSRYRKRLLKAGVEFFEIRVDRPGAETEWGHRPELITLHSKASVIDRETIFVGSLNFDPRSLLINTEMGLFIDSADVGKRFAETVLAELPATTFRVGMNENDDLYWVYENGGEREVYRNEPLAGWGRRFMVPLYRLLPIENQL